MPTHSSPGTRTAVWDLPLRIWHWAFALCIGGSLYTGLSGDIALVERHQQLGYCMVGLLLFRMAWGIWGGRYARFREYRFSPGKIVGHFLPHSLPPSREAKGEPSATAHTAPGAAIAIVFILLAVAQASTGLFATDDIFTEGPLTRYVDDATASTFLAYV